MIKIRLRRLGARNRPFYRVVVANSRRAASAGAAIEEVGFYDPIKQPAELRIDKERVDYWVGKGAQLSDTVKSLLARA